MKTCFKCKVKKPLTEFYKHREMADGHLGKCKPCARGYATKHRGENIDAIRANDKIRHKGRNPSAYIKEWRRRFPNKYKAEYTIGNAIRAGLIERQPCEICGAEKSHAHHDDYSKPMQVRWLCAVHHKEWHTKNGEGKNY